MKKIAVIIATVMLTACTTTVPVTAKFPEAPTVLMEKCPDLAQLKDDAKLSDVAKTVTLNYTTYYECSLKLDAWTEWYQVQKKIFESVK